MSVQVVLRAIGFGYHTHGTVVREKVSIDPANGKQKCGLYVRSLSLVVVHVRVVGRMAAI